MATSVWVPTATWQEKPPAGTPIDWTHPLSQKLFAAYPMNEMSGTQILDVAKSGVNGTFGAGAAAPTWSTARDVPGIEFGGDDFLEINDLKAFFANWGNDFTILFGAGADSFQQGAGVFNCVNDSLFLVAFGTGWGTGYDVYWNGWIHLTSGNSVADGSIQPFAFSSYNATSHEAFHRGVSVDKDTTSKTLSYVAAVRLGFTSNTYFTGGIAYVYIFHPALTPTEVAALSSNPWQIFDSPRLFFSSTAGGAAVTGDAAQTVPQIIQAASGTLSIVGPAGQTLAILTQTAAGVIANPVSGAAAQVLASLTQSAGAARGSIFYVPLTGEFVVVRALSGRFVVEHTLTGDFESGD